MSNPYPMLHRLDGRPVPGIPASLLPGLMRSVRSVERRTEFTAWFNTMTGSVIWMLGRDSTRSGALEEVLFQRGRYLPIEPDRTCRNLSATRKSWRQKMRAVERRRAANKDRLRVESGRLAENIVPDFRDRAAYLVRKIMDGPRSRPSVLVP